MSWRCLLGCGLGAALVVTALTLSGSGGRAVGRDVVVFGGVPCYRAPDPVVGANGDLSPPAAGTAKLVIRLPANAILWINGIEKEKQTGTERVYHTDPLDPKKKYYYEVRARWTEKGGLIQQTREVVFRADKTVEVDFFKPPE